jgi:hypothetical protein
MTGLEGAAAGVAGKAIVDHVKDKRAERKAEHAALVESMKETPGFKQAADIRGRKVAVREQWGLMLMRPLAGIMGVAREYFESDFAKDFGEVLAGVPEENRQTPKASIAGPAFEGLAYSIDEPKLKQMYLELIARASDDRVANNAHPSFVQIIRDLTSEEAAYLPQFLRRGAVTPVVQYRILFKPQNGHNILTSHVLDLREDDGSVLHDPMVPTYVDNWVRLKLVSVEYNGPSLTRPGAYDWQEARPERAEAQASIDRDLTPEFQQEMTERGIESVELECALGVMSATDFGSRFAEVVGMIQPKS